MAKDRPTRRELEVLEAVCQPGGSIASAAHELGISAHTARHTLRRLYASLGVSSVAQAVYALHAPPDDRR
jgi:ATP/maltotriose-dependent transcriptional regulator MalT